MITDKSLTNGNIKICREEKFDLKKIRETKTIDVDLVSIIRKGMEHYEFILSLQKANANNRKNIYGR